jgi:hypothetical protein
MKTCLLCLLTTVAATPAVYLAADDSQQTVIGRLTNDRLGDLIDALVRAGRTEDALRLCKDQSERLDPTSDMAAKWAIRESQVLTAHQMTATEFGKSQVAAAQKPIAVLLNAYPSHRRAIFLQAQLIGVRQAAATHRVVQASISASDDAKDEAAESLVRAMTATSELAKSVADERTVIDRQSESPAGFDADLNRLQQELSVDVVTLSLMQTELFSRDSQDCIAAATKAEQAATQAINRIPADSPARAEVQRLRIAAILRAGQSKRAATEFDRLRESIDQSKSPPWLALQVQVKLAQGSEQEAASLLAGYFGDSPARAPRSIEMDVARLEYLLVHKKDQIASWFDTIEERGGDYARRRAESIALARVGEDATDSKLDPSLLAVQGRAWLRKGDRIRAGELLSLSAAADDKADRALRHAAEAAAAFASVGRREPAARTLIDTALAHKQEPGAAAAHLQAIMLLRTAESTQIEQLLRSQLEMWPTGTNADHARNWLYKILNDQGRFTDAAVAISNVPANDLTDHQFTTIADAWRAAFHQSKDVSLSQPSQRFREAMRPLMNSSIVNKQYRTLASMLLNRDSLAGLPESSLPDLFVDAFIEFRQQGTKNATLRAVPPEHASDARWRLMQDGRTLPQLRRSIAKVLQNWDSGLEPTVDRAELLLWSADVDAAIEMLNGLIQSSGRDVDTLRQAATVLSSTDDRKANEDAVRKWDEVAAGTAKGGLLWHQAKLSAIRLLRKSGNHSAATKRAKYILLTMPKIDAEQRQTYESVIP